MASPDDAAAVIANLNLKQEDGDGDAPGLNTPQGRYQRALVHPYKRSPGCDLHVSKNTLKYHDIADLVPEIQPRENKPITKHNPVYISERDLQLAKNKTTVREMVRLLMNAIFTEKALQECSMGGQPAVGFNHDNADKRPGLDINAREAIIDFVLGAISSSQDKEIKKAMYNELEARRKTLHRQQANMTPPKTPGALTVKQEAPSGSES